MLQRLVPRPAAFGSVSQALSAQQRHYALATSSSVWPRTSTLTSTTHLRTRPSFVRSSSSSARVAVPRQTTGGLEQFWKGGVIDPDATALDKSNSVHTGDPWPACLLRLKSFEDLHKLWYVCLKEKNFLLTERHACRQAAVRWKHVTRMKKVKLSMKRILTVLSRREIHQQVLRSKEILRNQEEREKQETRRFHLEESVKQLEHKIKRMGNKDSLMKQAWRGTLTKYKEDLESINAQLQPLRLSTMHMLVPDWRYMRKYSDLPGAVNWRKQWIRALQDRPVQKMRYH
eukprot:GEMP01091966.1.p1 GENE.GEMP01091966.1~~GEMP01091966.1.p1  ORF type:complete len:295 (-),score=45.41 GEMP01091966.1:25-885(-)